MSSKFFHDLDVLIEQSVAAVTAKEKAAQSVQAQVVKKAGLVASKKKKNDSDDVEEMDDEKEKKDGDDESIPKMTGSDSDKSQKEPNDSSKKPGTQTSKKLADPSLETLKNPKFDDVAAKVNVLRGGKSLKNADIHKSVEQYFLGLSVAERAAFLTFLTNLGQLSAPVKGPDQVKDPSDRGIDTKFKLSKSDPTSEKSNKNNISKDDEKQAKTKTANGAIVVGG